MSRIFKEFGCAIGELDATRQVQRAFASFIFRIKSTQPGDSSRNMVKINPAYPPYQSSG
jgi:hypothetical protein